MCVTRNVRPSLGDGFVTRNVRPPKRRGVYAIWKSAGVALSGSPLELTGWYGIASLYIQYCKPP